MPRRLIALLIATTTVGLLPAAPALAALTDEVSAGQTVAARLQSGQASCQSLSNSDFEHLGEYVMDRMAGSRATHEAMNARMDTMMGSANADRMHQALGRRYADCPTTSSSDAGMMTGGMMGAGSTGAGGWGAMMGSGYAWMRNGAWQHMSRADWQHTGSYMMGNGWMMHPSSGWSTGAVLGAILAALALGGVVAYAVLRRPRRHGRPSHPSTA
ncbi:MAG TPA: hypothetical protein VKV27_02865 [Solirubrobacteraceae bacterium]|nr:hypothetical protein [Solirubrobacteraceae bacterium]